MQNIEFNDFLAWERTTNDVLDFKVTYADIAGADVIVGMVLSHIMYFYLPSKDGRPDKLRVRTEAITGSPRNAINGGTSSGLLPHRWIGHSKSWRRKG